MTIGYLKSLIQGLVYILPCLSFTQKYQPVVVIVAEVGVVSCSPQLSGSLSNGGLLGPDLHPWQGLLSGEQEEWRTQALGEEE